jgi:hypothetical protein
MQVASVKANPVYHGRGKEWHQYTTKQKKRSVTLLDQQSDISGYHADIHEGHGTVGAGQGRGTAWARRAMCESAFRHVDFGF